MQLVIDANIVFSALLRNGITRKVAFDRRLQLSAPVFLLEEIRKHYPLFEKKSGMTKDAFAKLTGLMLSKIQIVETSSLIPYAQAAKLLSSDKKDEVYAACALAINAEIWSNDKGFQTGRIKVWRTEELASFLFID